ncbi:hypothetical protein, partial [Streptomyces sp. NPDC003077]|uniref:hypothetical protein n=1 Tax=Streptomyces sp. NPDC003077 TaxID=3154443 RepID=UPI0033A3B2F6
APTSIDAGAGVASYPHRNRTDRSVSRRNRTGHCANAIPEPNRSISLAPEPDRSLRQRHTGTDPLTVPPPHHPLTRSNTAADAIVYAHHAP